MPALRRGTERAKQRVRFREPLMVYGRNERLKRLQEREATPGPKQEDIEHAASELQDREATPWPMQSIEHPAHESESGSAVLGYQSPSPPLVLMADSPIRQYSPFPSCSPAASGNHSPLPVLMDGSTKQEYPEYDSCGYYPSSPPYIEPVMYNSPELEYPTFASDGLPAGLGYQSFSPIMEPVIDNSSEREYPVFDSHGLPSDRGDQSPPPIIEPFMYNSSEGEYPEFVSHGLPSDRGYQSPSPVMYNSPERGYPTFDSKNASYAFGYQTPPPTQHRAMDDSGVDLSYEKSDEVQSAENMEYISPASLPPQRFVSHEVGYESNNNGVVDEESVTVESDHEASMSEPDSDSPFPHASVIQAYLALQAPLENPVAHNHFDEMIPRITSLENSVDILWDSNINLRARIEHVTKPQFESLEKQITALGQNLTAVQESIGEVAIRKNNAAAAAQAKEGEVETLKHYNKLMAEALAALQARDVEIDALKQANKSKKEVLAALQAKDVEIEALKQADKSKAETLEKFAAYCTVLTAALAARGQGLNREHLREKEELFGALWPQGLPEGADGEGAVEVAGAVNAGRGQNSPGFCTMM